MRRELVIGLLMQSIIIVMVYFFDAPDLFLGIFQGISLGLMIIGVIPTQYYLGFKNWKSTAFNSK
ncbi:hypothetical protein [Alkalibacterium sp. 20]|uniref:hypothetical protein n=1 Tax=Alkalibacterium sp. 20 TaxID=1798803 RepID=UPI0008FFF74A|nr:hypothetical protein [Alkalibacterium sp. 20]OJF91685.1 hypothetical protein AX762_10900 [Alkalibacterium sp. 20]